MNRFAILRPRAWITFVVGIVGLVGGILLAQTPSAQAAVQSIAHFAIPAIPATINYQGHLRNADGTLTTGVFNITARVYSAASGGSPLYTETLANVNVRDGLFNVVLGDINPLGTTFDGAPRFIGITLNSGSELTPRERVHGVPWAIHATNALSATNATNAGFATNAGNATTAGNATFAQKAGGLDSIGVDLYTANGFGGSPATQTLNVWNSNPDTTACFLSKVQTLAGQAAFCEVDAPNKMLRAGIWNYCEALCLSVR